MFRVHSVYSIFRRREYMLCIFICNHSSKETGSFIVWSNMYPFRCAFQNYVCNFLVTSYFSLAIRSLHSQFFRPFVVQPLNMLYILIKGTRVRLKFEYINFDCTTLNTCRTTKQKHISSVALVTSRILLFFEIYIDIPLW